jgi:hypothetical protein
VTKKQQASATLVRNFAFYSLGTYNYYTHGQVHHTNGSPHHVDVHGDLQLSSEIEHPLLDLLR